MSSARFAKCFVWKRTARKRQSLSSKVGSWLSLGASCTGGLEAAGGHWAELGLAEPCVGAQVWGSAGTWWEVWTEGRGESMGRRLTLPGTGCPLRSHTLFPALPQ